MTVHAVRVETAKTSAGVPVETILSQFRDAYPEALPEQASAPGLIEPTGTEPLDTPYRAALFRFEESAVSRQDLVDDLEQRLQGNPAWFRIRYHVCSHDLPADDPNRDCSEWSVEVENGAVPVNLA